jgi:hypothetical protein
MLSPKRTALRFFDIFVEQQVKEEAASWCSKGKHVLDDCLVSQRPFSCKSYQSLLYLRCHVVNLLFRDALTRISTSFIPTDLTYAYLHTRVEIVECYQRPSPDIQLIHTHRR